MPAEKEGTEPPKKALIGRTLWDVLSELFSRHGLRLVRPVLIGCGIAGFLWIWAYVRDAEDRSREVYQERLDAANIQLQDTFVKTANLTKTQMETLTGILDLQKRAQVDLKTAQDAKTVAQESAKAAMEAESQATRKASDDLKQANDELLRLKAEAAEAARKREEAQRQTDELSARVKTLRDTLGVIDRAAKEAGTSVPEGLKSQIVKAGERNLEKAAVLLQTYFGAPGPESAGALQSLVGSSESEVEAAIQAYHSGPPGYWLRMDGDLTGETFLVGVGSEDPTSCRDLVALSCREGTVRDVSCIRRLRALSLPDPEDWNRWLLLSLVELQESPSSLESEVFRIVDRRRPETWTLRMLHGLERSPEGTHGPPAGDRPGRQTLTPEALEVSDPGLLETMAQKSTELRESVDMLGRARAIVETPQAWKQLHLQILPEGLQVSFGDLVMACVKGDQAGARSLMSRQVDVTQTGILAALLLRKEFKIAEVDRDSNRMMQQNPAAADAGPVHWVVHAQGTSDGLYDRSVRMEFERKAASRGWILVSLGDDAIIGTRK